MKSWTKEESRAVLDLLDSPDKLKLVALVVSQVINSALDLIAILLLGFITASTFVSIQGQSPNFPEPIRNFLELLPMQPLSFNQEIGVLAGVAGICLVIKTGFSAMITRTLFRFLSIRSAKTSIKLLERIVRQDFLFFTKNSSSEIQFSVLRGTNSIFMGIVGSLVAILNEVFFLVIMFVGLGSLNLLLTLISMSYFAFLGIVQSKRFGSKIQRGNESVSKRTISIESNIGEIVSLVREVKLRGTRDNLVNSFAVERIKNARITASIQFIPFVMKYWMEIGLITGALLLSGIQFALYSAQQVIPTLVVFLAAATRIMPSILRIQNAYLAARGSIGSGKLALEYFSKFNAGEDSSNGQSNSSVPFERTESMIDLHNISFGYDDAKILRDISLLINAGEIVSIVGPSGGGKSTLLNIMMGQVAPDSGLANIMGQPAKYFAERFPGKIGYVSQEPVFLDATIRENLLLGLLTSDFSDSDLWKILDYAQLAEYVRSLPDGLNTRIGPRGAKLSMGQKQRLSLSRALLTRPRLLFLDEATSSLDVLTEDLISKAITKFRGQITVVAVAHRLSTVRQSDKVFYLESGKIVAEGTFEELRLKVPDFDKAAQISGL